MVEYERTQDREPAADASHKICVVGIGGGGLNVLDRICLDRLMEATLVSMHTDVRVLSHSMGPVKIQLGAEMMRGIGCGGDPELGREAAEASREQIKKAILGHEMVFICTGLGGGTGSGAAPVVAEIAKELGALVFVFATTPFSFEGRRRLMQSELALEALQPFTDALILFENNRMGELILPKEGIQKAFSQADQLIGHSVRAISTMVNQPGIVRVGLADLTSALRSPNARCLFGFGEARGANRVPEALKRALKSPLVNQGLLLQHAENLIVHIAGGESTTLTEVDQLMKQLGKHVPEDTQIMFGVTVEPKLGDLLSVTLMSSLSAKDLGLEGSTRAATAERPSTRPSDPARPISKPVAPAAAEPIRQQAVHTSNGGSSNGVRAVEKPPMQAVAAPIAQPEFPTMEAPPASKAREIPLEELFAPEPAPEPVAPMVEAAVAPAPPAPVPAPVAQPSSMEMWFTPPEPPVETPAVAAVAPPVDPAPARPLQAPVARPPRQPQAPRAEAAPVPRAEAPVRMPAPVQKLAEEMDLEAPTAAAPQPQPPVHRPAPVAAQPATIMKTSIFSVVEDDDEDEEEDEGDGTSWAEKYISPKSQAAAPQIERREPAPARHPEPASTAPATTVVKTAVAAVAAAPHAKQASLNLHPEEVGRFKGTDKTIVEGEDLDVPTWMRIRGKFGK